MKLIALAAFSWAHRGCIVEDFQEGQEIDTDDPDLIRVSMEEGWTKDPDAQAEVEVEVEEEVKEWATGGPVDANSTVIAVELPGDQEMFVPRAQPIAMDAKADQPTANKARKSSPENK